MCVSTFLLVALTGVGQATEKKWTADEVLSKAVNQRRAIVSAAVKLECISEMRRADGRKQMTLTDEIWMDGDRLRVDSFYPKAP